MELTATVALPCETIKLDATVAVNWLAFTKVVGSGAPFQRTVELDTKPDPFTVKLKEEPPASVVAGDRLVITEVGVPPPAPVMVKTDPLEAVPFVLTVTVAPPCDAMRLPATTAVNWPALTKVVDNGVVFQRTVEAPSKPEPFTVRVNAWPPACAVDGLRLVTAGPVGCAPFRIGRT